MAEKNTMDILTEELKRFPTVLDLEQVADIIGVSRRTIDDFVKRGVIKAFALDPTKERKQYRVNKADLISYIINQK